MSTRAEFRRQKNQKDTIYRLTKSQIDAIKRQAVDEVTNVHYKDVNLKMRREYEQQLNERIAEIKKEQKEQRIRDINFIIPIALKACHDTFGWKVYQGDRYQRLLSTMIEILEDGNMTLAEVRKWVYQNLGIELKEVQR